MELKRGVLLLGHEEEMVFKNKMATLLCLDGLVYLINDDALQEAAERIDKLPPIKARTMAQALFGGAHCVHVGKRNKVYIKDAPKVCETLSDSFDALIIDKGICVLIPEGKSREDIEFFKYKLTE